MLEEIVGEEVVFSGQQLIRFRPDFTNTEPAANIGPFPQWADKKKIVSMDPLGHLAPWLFKDTIEKENGRRADSWNALDVADYP
jgi:GTP cyclohydrolase N terminal